MPHAPSHAACRTSTPAEPQRVLLTLAGRSPLIALKIRALAAPRRRGRGRGLALERQDMRSDNAQDPVVTGDAAGGMAAPAPADDAIPAAAPIHPRRKAAVRDDADARIASFGVEPKLLIDYRIVAAKIAEV